jgi:hypothetical protein
MNNYHEKTIDAGGVVPHKGKTVSTFTLNGKPFIDTTITRHTKNGGMVSWPASAKDNDLFREVVVRRSKAGGLICIPKEN